MSIKWNKTKTEALIGLVFQNPELWDKTLGPVGKAESADIWASIAKELGFERNQVRNKWKTLHATYQKKSSQQPKPRSGDAATHQSNKKWCYLSQMSFLRDKTFRDSTGNLDKIFNDDDYSDISDDENDDKQETQQEQDEYVNKERLPSIASSVNSTDKSVIKITRPMVEHSDPAKKSEWMFLASTLDYFSKMTDEKLKFQLRLEIFCLLFNFRTENIKVKGYPCVKKKSNSEMAVTVIHKKEIKREIDSEAVQQNANEKPIVHEDIRENESNIFDEDEIMFLDSSNLLTAEKRIKTEITEEVVVNPSTALQTLLLNPFVIKKEK